MKYLNEILWLISWPVMIWISFKISIWAIRKYESSVNSSKKEQEG